MRYYGFLILLVAFFLSLDGITQEPLTPIISTGVPKDFKDLDAPQEIIADIYFGGKKIGSTSIIGSLDSVTFLEPEPFIDIIPNLIDPAAMIPHLLHPLPANNHLSCFPLKKPDCGIIDTEHIDVIYTPELFRVDLFIKGTLLETKKEKPRYLPTKTTGLSSLLGISGTYLNSNNRPSQYNFRNTGLLAYNNSHINTLFTYSENNDFIVEDFNVERHHKDIIYKAGFFGLNDLSVIAAPRIFGVGLNSSIQSRDDLGRAYSNKIQIFLPFRSRINIKRDGKLLDSRMYDAGNQFINTERLPSGSYDIILEIVDHLGDTRVEEHFFIKSTEITPDDQPFYWAEIGFLRDSLSDGDYLPQFSDVMVGRIGIAKRLHDKVSATANIIASKQEAAMEVGYFYEDPKFQINHNFLYTSKSDMGSTFDIEYRNKKWYLTAGARRIIRGKVKEQVQGPDFDPISRERSTARFSADYTMDNATVGFSARWNKAETGGAAYSFGPTFRWNVYRKGRFNIDLNGDFTQTERDFVAFFNVRFFNRTKHWSLANTVRSNVVLDKDSDSNEESNNFVSQNFTWQDGVLYDEEVNINFRNDLSDDGISIQEVGGDVEGRYGKLDVRATHNKKVSSINSVFDINILQKGKYLAAGGRKPRQAGVIVNIESDNPKDKFEIIANGGKIDTVPAGSTTPVMLTPFQSYSVSVNSAGASFSELDSGPKEVTLYPGNVEYFSWKAKNSIIFISQAVRPDGQPLSNAVLLSSLEETTADEFGNFQIMAFTDDIIDVTPKVGTGCTLTIPKQEAKETILWTERITCH